MDRFWRRLTNTFTSFRVRNFRIFFSSQLISVTGTWMQSVAQMWLVLHLTGSGVALGITTALQFTPMLLFGTYGGLLADRADKRRLLLASQSVMGLLALTLGALTVSGKVELWMVYALALALGVVQVIDNPTRQSFVSEIVGPRQITNAIALNSAVFTGARVIGPAIAGVLIAVVGTGWCFVYNGFSYFPVVVGLLLMRPAELHRSTPLARAPGQIKAGVRYAWGQREIRLPLLMLLVIGTFAFNFSVLMPLMARFAFNSGPQTFGALLSVMGAGAFAGALLSAGRRPTHRVLGLAALGFGGLMIGAAAAPTLWLEFAILVPMGFAMITFQATANSLIQLNSDPAFRGRLMALYMIVFIGSTPIGGPLVGLVAQTYGPRAGLALGGVAAVSAGLAAMWALRRWRLGTHDSRPESRELVGPSSQPVA